MKRRLCTIERRLTSFLMSTSVFPFGPLRFRVPRLCGLRTTHNRLPPRILPAVTVLAAALVAASVSAAGGAATPAGELTPGDLARLERGETVARLVAVPGAVGREGLAARLLPWPPERLFRTVADVDHWSEWVPFLERSQRRHGPGGDPEWSFELDLPFPLRDRRYRARVTAARPEADGGGADSEGWTVAWASVPGSGNVAAARGAFTLTRHGPARTLVVFRSATETGDRTPRALQERALLESLPWVLDGLRQQVNRCRYMEPWSDGCPEERPWAPE